MADMLADGAAWMAGQLASAAGRTVAYQRGASSATVTATVGRSQFEAANQSGVIEVWESRDFLIQTSSFPFGLPVRADRVVETVGGSQVTYEVATPRGIPVYHYSDAFRSMLRVHTKAIDDAATNPTPLVLRYVGASTASAITDQQIVAQLTSSQGVDRKLSQVVTATSGYLWVVLPDSFGTPILRVNGLPVTAWSLTTRSITFTGQSARSYRLYRSTYAVTGTVLLEVL